MNTITKGLSVRTTTRISTIFAVLAALGLATAATADAATMVAPAAAPVSSGNQDLTPAGEYPDLISCTGGGLYFVTHRLANGFECDNNGDGWWSLWLEH